MASPVLLKISQAATLTEEERAAISSLIVQTVAAPAGEDIVLQGETPQFSTVLLEGLAYRYCTLPDGRRAVVSFQIAGDWVDLHSLFLDRMDHSIGAVSACLVGKAPHAAVHALVKRYPHLGLAFWRDTTMDSAIMRQWLVNATARDARARMAHVFCEMQLRQQGIGQADDTGFDFPVTQVLLADAVGISVVHANRILQQLKADGLLEFARGHAVIHDLPALWRVAEFDPSYLRLDRGVDAAGA